MLIQKITSEELEFLECWHNPICMIESLFSNFDNLGDFDSERFGAIRLYQRPMISHESLIDFETTAKHHNLNEKKTFQLRKNVADIYNLGARKYGKCEYFNNYCSLADGTVKKFGELINTNQKVVSLNQKTWKLETANAYFYDNGIKECYKIITESGNKIILTENHPLLTDNGWKTVAELKEKDFVATAQKLPVNGNIIPNLNIAKLLGYLLGDGSTSQSSIGFTNINEEILKEIRNLANYFDCDIRHRGISYFFKNQNQYYRKNKKNFYDRKNKIQKLVLNYGINKLSKNKKIPNEVFQWEKKYIGILLNRLYACDGHINYHNFSIELTLASKELIYQIKNLLLRFGIHARIYLKSIEKFEAWRLIIAEDFDKFLDVIGIKSKDLGIRRKKSYSTANRIPRKFFIDKYSKFNGYKKELKLRNMKLYDSSKEKWERVATIVDDEEINKIAYSDIKWEKIKSKKYVGKFPTVMVSVPGNENYISNNIISHNSLCTLKLDIPLSSIYDEKLWGCLFSIDEKRLRGIADDVKVAFDFHPIFRTWKYHCSFKPEIKFTNKNTGWKLQGVNMTLKGKNPGEQFYQIHANKFWGDEVSFETDKVYKKRKESVSELGAIIRLAGMTDFPRHSPTGKLFTNVDNKKHIINLPQFVNPYWDEKEKKDRLETYGGEEALLYKIYVKGETVPDAYTEFDMERVEACYNKKKKIKRFELKKNQFSNFENLIIVDRPKNADRILILGDIGDGGGGSDINIWSEIGDRYYWLYNIVLYKMTEEEQYKIFNYLVDQTQANILGFDCGEACGRGLYDRFEKRGFKENLVWYAGNKKVSVGFEKDVKGDYVRDKKGQLIIREEFMSEWSVKRLKVLLYGERLHLPFDYKFDGQFSSVVCLSSGTRKTYPCISETGDHLFDCFKVFAIAQWLKKDFNATPSMLLKIGLGVNSARNKLKSLIENEEEHIKEIINKIHESKIIINCNKSQFKKYINKILTDRANYYTFSGDSMRAKRVVNEHKRLIHKFENIKGE